MSTFDETQHPRAHDGTFAEKSLSAPEAELAAPGRPAEAHRRLRGHDFYPKDGTVPPLGAQGHVPLDMQVVHAKFFGPAGHWWVTEMNPDTGDAFGYAQLAGMADMAEWGYIDLAELERVKVGPFVGVERDLHFDPREVRQCIPRYRSNGLVERSIHGTDIPSVAGELTQGEVALLRGDLRALDSGEHGAADLFVSSVMDGHLSRGVPGRERTASMQAWNEHADLLAVMTDDPEVKRQAEEFSRGIQKGSRALYNSKVDQNLGPAFGFVDTAETALTKRTSVGDRELWRAQLQQAESEAEWRGMMTAAAALSGTDTWWGLRDNPERTITGKD